jgi:hypothetical protein
MWAKPHTETITHITGKDMQVDVKDFLSRSLAVREADIDPLALDFTITQRCGDALRDAKHMRAFFRVELCKVRDMSVGNYQRVPGIYGLVVQESRAAIVMVNHADFHLARQYPAKYAVIRLAHRFRP